MSRHRNTKRTVGELHDCNARFRVLFDSSPVAIFIDDLHGNVLDANPAASELHGMSRAELVGTDMLDLVPVDHRGDMRRRFLELVSGDQSDTEGLARGKDGSAIPVSIRSSRFSYNGEPAILLQVWNNTAQNQTGSGLPPKYGLLNAILDAETDAISVKDRLGKCLMANKSFATMIGKPIGEIIGRVNDDLFPADVAHNTTNTDRIVISREQEVTGEEQMATTSCNDVRTYSTKKSPFRDEHGNVIGVVSLMRDITECKQTDDLLRQREHELARFVCLNSMGKMVAEVTHELSQPLFTISNLAKACSNRLDTGGSDKEEIIQWTRRIDDVATMAGKILKRLRGILRGKKIACSVCDMNELIAEAIDLVSFGAFRDNVAIRFSPLPSSVMVCVNRVQIQQVILNLMKNAHEAIEDRLEGECRITIHMSRKEDHVEIAVEDDGPGIVAVKVDQLFDAFFTTKKNGTGMGLAICRSIIEDHGGTIGAAPARKHGATFHFTLPLVKDGYRDER